MKKPRAVSRAVEKVSEFLTKQLSPEPHKDNPPPAVARFLLVGEGKRELVFIRQHPAIMVPALASASGALLGTVIASALSRGDQPFILVLWIIFAFLLMRSLLVILRWMVQYIVITDKTVILTAGAVTRTTTAFPLVNLTGMTLERTATGRLTGFGAFRLGANSPVQLVIDYVPYPEQLYLQIRDRIRAEQDETASG